MIRRLAACLLTALVALPAGQALAACAQKDVAGIWQVYSLGYQRGYEPYWTRCVLQVNAAGNFLNGTKCADMLGREVAASGQLRLSSGPICSFVGHITYAGIRSDVRHATLDRAKNHMDGVDVFSGGGFFFNATRR
ncbi:hypothetical protein [Geminicoccus flavidas]|uniref:hypothetical protein n=1 Tax=Geminicoccus flavidas TaxID=2506407 RepID=UPI00135C3304|nr:hypothetical protein [Geminicoccus flavidas]